MFLCKTNYCIHNKMHQTYISTASFSSFTFLFRQHTLKHTGQEDKTILKTSDTNLSCSEYNLFCMTILFSYSIEIQPLTVGNVSILCQTEEDLSDQLANNSQDNAQSMYHYMFSVSHWEEKHRGPLHGVYSSEDTEIFYLSPQSNILDFGFLSCSVYLFEYR